MLYFLNHPSEHIYTQENKNSGILPAPPPPPRTPENPYTHTYEFAVTAQQLAFVAHMVRALQTQGPVAPWPGGPGGAWPSLLLRPVGKLSMLSEIVKVVDGGGGKDLKCCRPENFFDFSEKFFGLLEKYCPWPLQKHGSHGATGRAAVRLLPEDLVLHFSQLFLVRS